MKIVNTYYYSHLAHLDLAKLSDEGIEAYIKDDNIVTMNIAYAQAVGGIKLMVIDEDYEKASAVLKLNEYDELKKEFDEEEIESQSKCSACGSVNVYHKGSWWTMLGFLVFYPFHIWQKKYTCSECGNEWKEKN